MQTVVLALPITVQVRYPCPTCPLLLANICGQPAIIERAWKAGKNVVSEKPIAKDLAEARRLIELWEGTYKPKGIQWIIAEQFPVSGGAALCEEGARRGSEARACGARASRKLRSEELQVTVLYWWM